jgi:hypothetical protein
MADDVSFLEQAKIQARVLVPLVKALRAELGEERANALVRKALADQYRKIGRAWWQRLGPGGPEGKMDAVWASFSSGEALEYKVLRRNPQAYEVDVTDCKYARFYKQLGEPELGFLLVCSQDFSLTDGFGSMRLERTQTIMQGASRCDFRYRLGREKP